MRIKRGKKQEVKAEVEAVETEVEEVQAEVVNADEMAAAASQTSGNDYQQYIRGLFEKKLG